MNEGEEHQNQSLESMSEEEHEFVREQIRFPSPPSQFAELYSIYKRNAEKISALNRELAQRQSEISELQQLANQQQVGSIIDFSEEETEQQVEARLHLYNSQRQKRAGEAGRLAEVYRKLKILATQENLLNNKDMNEFLHDWLAEHRKVISAKAEGSDLVVLGQESRTMHYLTRKNKNISLGMSYKRPREKGELGGSIDKRHSKDSVSSEDNPRHKKQYRVVHTLRVLDIEDYVKRLEEAGVEISPELEARKHEQQQYNMLIRLIRVGLKKKEELSQGNAERNRKIAEELQKNKRGIYEIVVKLAKLNEDREKRLPAPQWEQDCPQLREANKLQAEIYSKLVKLIEANEETKRAALHNQSDSVILEQIARQQGEIAANLILLITINEDKKQYLPLDVLEESRESLEQKQKQAERDVNLVRLVQVDYKTKMPVLLCVYYKPLELFFLYVKSSKILVVEGKRDTIVETGSVVHSVDLDSLDEVILFQVRGSRLYAGTKEGVVRIYQILANRLQLAQVYRCFNREMKWVDNYHLPFQPAPTALHFISDRNQVFELNLTTCLVTHIGDLPQRATTLLENYLITDSSIYNIAFKAPLQLTRNDKLTNWYGSYRLSHPSNSILHIRPSPSKVLTADRRGKVSVISV